MSEFLSSFIKKNRPQFLKYKSYISSNNWIDINTEQDPNPIEQKNKTKQKAEEHKLQNDLVSSILDRLKYFVNKSEGEHSLKTFKEFIKDSLDIIGLHTTRVDDYLESIDITKIENQEVRAEEIRLTKECFSGITRIQETIINLNIKEDQVAEGIQWFDKQKATLSMHDTLINQYPEIQKKLDIMGIDFISPPPKTIHILNQNPPKYNENKNYWEQEKDVLQYYVDEYKKIDQGLSIDGYFIDGWLYFHFNFFVTNIPKTIERNGVKENKDEVMVPELRDNEILITNYFIKSRKESTMSVIAATRRAAKTTLNSSRIFRAQILNKKQILCAGGSSEDLNHIHNNLDTCLNNINPAFKIYYLSNTEDNRGKAYGIKTKSNKSKVTNNVFIINLEGGSKKEKKESLAGFTPDEFILDEAMKFPFKSQLEALEPALWGSGILRCNVLLTGTGGTEELAKDAITMLNDPKGSRVTEMDWDELEKGVPEDLITWKRRKFGLFLPTQMCIKHVKIKSNLAKFVGIKSKLLSQIPLHITDWKLSKEAEEKEREAKIKDKTSYIKQLAYHPFDPDEIFLSGNINPFPVEELKKRKRDLIDKQEFGKKVTLMQDSVGLISYDMNNKDLCQYPHKGGFIDCPVVLYEDIPEFKPPLHLYLGGFDDYKQEEASTDSVGSFHIYKVNIGMDKWCGRVVASIATRPDPHMKLYRQIFLLMQAFNARVFMENADDGFKQYLDKKRATDIWLQESLDFKSDLAVKSIGRRKYGWTPTPANIKFLKNLAINYTKEEFEIENEKGEKITILGAQRLNDIVLIDEMINYREGNNVDRITSFMSCLGLEYYLDLNYMLPVINRQKAKQENRQKPKEKTMAERMYGNSRR